MSRLSTIIIFLLAVLYSRQIYSQDKIYLSSGAKEGKIINITNSFVSYRPDPEKKKTINISLRKVVLLFNEKGGYLILSKMNAKEGKSNQAIGAFLEQAVTYWPADRIYKMDKSMEEGKISQEDAAGVQISVNNQSKNIPDKSIAVIVYKDGRHSIRGSVDVAAEILNSVAGPYAGMYALPVSQIATNADKNTKPSDTAIKSESGPDITTTGNTKPAVIGDFLTDAAKKDFEERVLQKTKLFGDYLKFLCDKKNPQDEMNKVIDLGVGLFVNEDAIVQTSSVNRQDYKNRKIRIYLIDLKKLQYDHIDIEWTNVQYVTKLEQAQDGTYRGTVSFEQKFSGYRDGQLVYQDITVKKAEVILKKYTKIVEGQQQLNWEILLGNVGVSYTQKTLSN